MTFDEVLEQVRELLQSKGRVAYRALKRRFELDDEYLEDLKAELIDAEHVAYDEDGKVLVWRGSTTVVSASQPLAPQTADSASRTLSSPSPQTLDARHEAERRQLTVMFCDLVGSTALSEQLDPEELREVVSAYHETCASAISRYGGHTAQHLGDGLLVYFGYPAAHEDDAQRAVRTSLEILAALSSLNARLPSTIKARLPHPVQVRIGVHTGLVVIGAIGSGEKREILALGETPNLAARVQGVAAPDTVAISAVTQHLVQGLFECQDLGPQTLKGISTPLSLYRVVREGVAQSRFEVAVGIGLTPLVGREEELNVLQRCWTQAKGGAGQVVLVSGEPGIGKSRLVQELKEHVSAEGATCIEFRSSPYHQNSALYPIINHLQRLLQFQREETLQAKCAKLQQALAAYRFPQADTLPLLATLLSLPQPEGIPPLTLSPQKQKQKTQEALVAWMMEEAEQATVYCAWEDLHWADPSTLELLTLFLEQIPPSRVFAVLTFRPDFLPPWNPRSYLRQLALNRLGRAQVEAMVAKVTGGKALPFEVLQQIVAKTDGIPLFVEELTKTVVESGLLREAEGHYELTGSLPPLAIPSTLQDSLMARLDRLATVREVAQLGATLGREFSAELIQAVSSLDAQTLQNGLAQLVGAELIYQRGVGAQARYVFKHALIQDAAYQSLLKSKRQQLHQQIAQVMEERFPEIRETQPELLAHHYTAAGLIAQAIPYWQQAGRRALQRSAPAEALSHLTTGLEVLTTLPDSLERTQQELVMQTALGAALMAIKGYGAPEVECAYTRARELCQQVEGTPQLFPTLFGLWRFYLQRAELQTAQELGEQLLTLAQDVQDSTLLPEACRALGGTLYFLGQFAPAREHLEQGITSYDLHKLGSHTFLYGDDPGVVCRCCAAHTLWLLGYPDQALQRSDEAVALAQELSHSLSLAYALTWAAWLRQYRGERQGAQERAEATVKLCAEQGFPFWGAAGAILRGWALTEQRQDGDGIVQLRQGLAALRATGAKVALQSFLAMLARAYEERGQTEEGLSVVAEALTPIHKTGERYYEAELYRLKGTLTLQFQVQDPKSKIEKEAEECFLKAIDIARRQQAKSLELRAVMSLSRLWQQQGKKKKAHDMLAEIYGWFTEGFDTKDLQEAKRLIEELS